MSYWGYKFEQYVTVAKQGDSPNTSEPVNINADFTSIVRSRLNKHSLVIGGKVDCQMDDGNSYVELKTSREIHNQNQYRKFQRFKLLKWWTQSFLLSVPTIICGFRDDDGTVHRLEEFATLDIPKYCEDLTNAWDPAVCFNFCDTFLQHIKDTG